MLFGGQYNLARAERAARCGDHVCASVSGAQGRAHMAPDPPRDHQKDFAVVPGFPDHGVLVNTEDT
jgi:hypothetical protein